MAEPNELGDGLLEHHPVAVCLYMSIRPHEPGDEKREVFYAHGTQVRSRSGRVLVVYCEHVVFTAWRLPTPRARQRSQVLTYETEQNALTPNIVDGIRALAREWGIEK
jgi:hypothetical protein